MPKLLIADGSPMMHRIMELTFAPEGLQVLTASDGEQAIALLPIARPDVVIADHALARRNGYEVAAFIREHGELGPIPILLLASPFEPLDRERAEAAGVAGEISKPFDPGHLVMRVRELLARKHAPPALQVPPSDREPAPSLKLVTPAGPPVRGALDDYFDRLDAALAKLDDQFTDRTETAPPVVPLASDAPRPAIELQNDVDDAPRVPTLDDLLGTPSASPEDQVSRGTSGSTSTGTLIEHPLRGAYAEAEQKGADGATPHNAPSEVEEAAVAASPINEALVDEVTRRVLERLAPGAVSQVVNDVVTRVAERLLREEIARLK